MIRTAPKRERTANEFRLRKPVCPAWMTRNDRVHDTAAYVNIRVHVRPDYFLAVQIISVRRRLIKYSSCTARVSGEITGTDKRFARTRSGSGRRRVCGYGGENVYEKNLQKLRLSARRHRARRTVDVKTLQSRKTEKRHGQNTVVEQPN